MAWEYTTIKAQTDWGLFMGRSLNCANINFELNRLGQDGWELVSSFDINSGHGESREVIMIFKRSTD